MPNPPAALAECAALFRPTLAMSARPVPAPPGAERLSHDETLVLFAKPRQLLGEHRHALAPGTGHLRDVRAPRTCGWGRTHHRPAAARCASPEKDRPRSSSEAHRSL